MKKSFYLAALAIAALSSCSSDDQVASGQAQNSEDLVPIVLGIGTPAVTVSTRGTGTVGSTEAATNKWNNEKVRVLMTTIPDDGTNYSTYSTFGFTEYEGYGGANVPLFDNSFYCKPVEQTSGTVNLVCQAGTTTRYYPSGTGKNSDFFAYYVDDATSTVDGETIGTGADKAPKIHQNATTPETMSVKFEMNGSQDIMAGKAVYDPNFTGFSAKASRAGVTPSITMDHLLTRLQFKAVPGKPEATGVKVKSINVTSKYKGELTVAYNERTVRDANTLIDWDDAVKKLVLMQKDPAVAAAGEKNNLIALEAVPLDYENTPDGVIIGESMFVKPDETSYTMELVLDYTDIDPNLNDETITLTIKTTSGNKLVRGNSYLVTIKVYGVKEIAVETTLTAWEEGEEIQPLNDDAIDYTN